MDVFNVKKVIKRYKKKRFIKRLRNDFIFVGVDSINATDEEIYNGMINIANCINNFGATKEQAEKAFKVMSK